MADVGRYRRVYSRIWRHAGFKSLPPASRALTLYLLSGPQANRLGLFFFSPAVAAEDLGATAETIRRGLADVAETFGWLFDSTANMFYIPSWWRWNPPQNANVLKGNLKDLNEIAASPLVDAFAGNIRTLDVTLHQTFLEGIEERLPKRTRIQEQFQEPLQEQEIRRRAARGSDEKRALRVVGDCDERSLSIARKTLTHTTAHSDVDHLVDVFHQVTKAEGVTEPFTRATVIVALNTALSERRQAAS